MKIFVMSANFVLTILLSQSSMAKILSVGAIAINPCQDAKVLADWYTRFGIETEEIKGGYYGQLETAAGAIIFGIHPKKENAPAHCPANIAVVYRVENLAESLQTLKTKGLEPESLETDEMGKFAEFHDPDGNNVTMWEQ